MGTQKLGGHESGAASAWRNLFSRRHRKDKEKPDKNDESPGSDTLNEVEIPLRPAEAPGPNLPVQPEPSQGQGHGTIADNNAPGGNYTPSTGSPVEIQEEPTKTADAGVKTASHNVYSPEEVAAARSDLWQKAYMAVFAENKELVLNFEAIIKDDANLDQDANLFSSEAIEKVVTSQQTRMENKQWTFQWFDKPVKLRDTIEGILSTLEYTAPIIGAGMQFAPPFVSVPWSFVSMIIPFVMRDFTEMQSALDGLQDLTSILSSYSIAEYEFLSNSATRTDFQASALTLYTKIFEYQALAAQHFAASTIKRLGRNMKPGTPWQDALAALQRTEELCQNSLNGLAVRLHQTSFRSMEQLLSETKKLVKMSIDESSARRTQNKQIIEWISTINPFQDHADIRKRLGDDYFGSGEWLLQDETKYTAWRKSSSGKLLLQGVVGTGKSSLVSIVLESCMAGAEGRLAFNYCSANSSPWDPVNTIRNDTANIFRSILAQCAVQTDGSIAGPIKDTFEKSTHQGAGESELGLDATLKLLVEVLTGSDDQFTFVFDALDELSDHQSFLDSLKAVQVHGKKLRVFFSSRFGIDISPEFPGTVLLPIESKGSKDIQTYVKTEIERRWKNSGIKQGQAVRLETALTSWSDGVFRWVVLELDIFLPRSRRQGSKFRATDFEARLIKLEKSRAPAVDRLFLAYDQIYSDALGEEDEYSRRQIVKSAMKWVLCTFRPFTAEELALVVTCSQAVDQKLGHRQCRTDDSSSADGFLEEEEEEEEEEEGRGGEDAETSELDPVSEEDVLSYCANFIIKTPKGLIRLAHLSVRQYFEGKNSQDFNPGQQHLEAALASVMRLSGQIDRSSPFTDNYFKQFWPIHARSAADSTDLAGTLESDEFQKRPGLTLLQMKIARKSGLEERDPLGNTVLHNAILYGSLDEAQLILNVHVLFQRSSPLVKLKNYSGDIPLHIAASRGLGDRFKLLLLSRSSIKALNDLGLTPLHMAVLFGHETIVRVASDSGVTMDSLDKSGGSALHTAAFSNVVDIGRILVTAGLSKAQQNCQGNTPLDISQTTNALDFAPLLVDTQQHGSAQAAVLDALHLENTLHRKDTLQRAAARPKVLVTGGLACQLCNVEEWIDGSRQSLVYLHSPSFEVLKISAQSCKLCKYILTAIQSAGAKQDLGNKVGSRSEEISVRVSLAEDSRAGVVPRDLLSIFYGRDFVGQLEFCIDHDFSVSHAAASLFRGRKLSGYESSISVLVDWLWDCHNTHRHCTVDPPDSLPLRLVDIGEYLYDPPRLVDSRDLTPEKCKYVFFSWAWGIGNGVPMTLLRNIDIYKEGIPHSDIPPLFRDLMHVCRALGYRYVFIDCFCVIQDTKEDWERLADRMSAFISNADLVVAATGSGVNQSLFGKDATEIRQSIAELHALLSNGDDNEQHHEFTLHLRKPLDTGKEVMYKEILSRSWRAQEALLAKRLLIFGQNEPIWNCGNCLKSEGAAAPQAPIFRNTGALKSMALAVMSGSPDPKNDDLKRYILSQWYHYVEMITAGVLRMPTDRLPATAGVARETNAIIASVTGETSRAIDGYYYAGLHMDDIYRSLLWAPVRKTDAKDNQKVIVQDSHDQPFLSLGPSWTWASWLGGVSYHLSPFVAAASSENSPRLGDLGLLGIELNMHGQGQYWSTSSDPRWAHAESGHISAQGHMREVSYSGELRMFDIMFDAKHSEEQWLGAEERFFLLVVTRLAYTATGHDHRWVGLILRASEDHFSRVGLFLGPDCQKDLLVDWKVQSLTIV